MPDESSIRDFRRWAGARLPEVWDFLKHRLHRGERYGLGFTLALLAVGAALWAFLKLIDGITEREAVYFLDFQIRQFVSSLISPEWTTWVVRITDFGDAPVTTVLVVVIAGAFLLRKQWWNFFQIVFTTAGGALLIVALKTLFHRSRPVEKLVPASGYSFPSGHAFMAMMFYGIVIYLTWISTRSRVARFVVTTLGVIMILLIGASRVYLGVHWLTDVMGGYTAGFIWLVSSIFIVRIAERRRSSDAQRAPEPHPFEDASSG